jgi:hypothetical protein
MANVGEVYFKTDLQFKDGATGDKLIVLLAVDQFTYIFAKTTSQDSRRDAVAGCQKTQTDYHSFHIPAGTTKFVKPTWVCLNEYYEMFKTGFDANVKAGLIGYKFKIDACPVLACAVSAIGNAATQDQMAALTASMAKHCTI